MSPLTSISLLLVSCLPLLTHAGVTQADVTGYGKIYVLESSDWKTATPAQTVGCLTDSGRFLGLGKKSDNDTKKTSDEKKNAEKECGIFHKLEDYPYTISSREGNCTFNTEKTEKNVDSTYGRTDHAWICDAGVVASVYDGLYTIDGFPYAFLCWGDIACFYDAKDIPSAKSKGPLWQFRWGSQQRGITPGHVQTQLLFEKVSDTPKREGEQKLSPGPRVELDSGVQAPLRGVESRS